jgi:hypothetical protein
MSSTTSNRTKAGFFDGTMDANKYQDYFVTNDDVMDTNERWSWSEEEVHDNEDDDEGREECFMGGGGGDVETMKSLLSSTSSSSSSSTSRKRKAPSTSTITTTTTNNTTTDLLDNNEDVVMQPTTYSKPIKSAVGTINHRHGANKLKDPMLQRTSNDDDVGDDGEHPISAVCDDHRMVFDKIQRGYGNIVCNHVGNANFCKILDDQLVLWLQPRLVFNSVVPHVLQDLWKAPSNRMERRRMIEDSIRTWRMEEGGQFFVTTSTSTKNNNINHVPILQDDFPVVSSTLHILNSYIQDRLSALITTAHFHNTTTIYFGADDDDDDDDDNGHGDDDDDDDDDDEE